MILSAPPAAKKNFINLAFASLLLFALTLATPPESLAAGPRKGNDGDGAFAGENPAYQERQELAPAGQRYSPRQGQRLQPGAILDDDVYSPKSLNFSPDGTKIFVNALEGFSTLVYSFPDLKKIAVIPHKFSKRNASLFKDGETTLFDYRFYSRKDNLNVFSGKPVEGAFSRDGRFFFVPYYRRDFDRYASDPSAMAVIDAKTNKIARVLPTGPLPKMVAVSPNGDLLAVTHWGDNTIGLLDISSGDPDKFAYTRLLVVEPRLSTKGISGNRDSNCGHCLRGTVFTPDGRHLLVGRMSGGGIAVFSMPDGEYEGGFTAFSDSPRHLVVDSKGTLYASDSRHGIIARVGVSEILDGLKANPKKQAPGPKGESVYVGSLPRTVSLSPDEKSLYAVLHGAGELARVDLDSFKVAARIPVSPRPVGLDVSPDGAYLGLTSQGGVDKSVKPPAQFGGNSFEIYRIGGR
jgi:DNA-binding beta-propeller fold protein YncE